MAETAIERPR